MNEDHGPGNVSMFPALDLEELYRRSHVDHTLIQGKSLNEALCVNVYEPDAWYRVTSDGVEKI